MAAALTEDPRPWPKQVPAFQMPRWFGSRWRSPPDECCCINSIVATCSPAVQACSATAWSSASSIACNAHALTLHSQRHAAIRPTSKSFVPTPFRSTLRRRSSTASSERLAAIVALCFLRFASLRVVSAHTHTHRHTHTHVICKSEELQQCSQPVFFTHLLIVFTCKHCKLCIFADDKTFGSCAVPCKHSRTHTRCSFLLTHNWHQIS